MHVHVSEHAANGEHNIMHSGAEVNHRKGGEAETKAPPKRVERTHVGTKRLAAIVAVLIFCAWLFINSSKGLGTKSASTDCTPGSVHETSAKKRCAPQEMGVPRFLTHVHA
jgi:hypothetical protein